MKTSRKIILEVKKSGVIEHNPDLCRGCKICEVACSAYHEGVCSSYLSRIHVVAEDLNLNFPAQTCHQCDYPSCYFACPLRDKALCIDNATGVRYINEDKCTGCGICARACPFPDKPIWEKKAGEKVKFFKCDLCKDRNGGPLCIEVCPRNALTFVERAK